MKKSAEIRKILIFLCYLVAPGAISGLLAAENPRKSAEFRKFAENSRPWLLFINLLNFTLNCIFNFRNTSLPLRNGFITPMGVITPRLRTTALEEDAADTQQWRSKVSRGAKHFGNEYDRAARARRARRHQQPQGPHICITCNRGCASLAGLRSHQRIHQWGSSTHNHRIRVVASSSTPMDYNKQVK